MSKKNRRTKAIAPKTPDVGGAKEAAATSMVGRVAGLKALTYRQLYEQTPSIRSGVSAYADLSSRCARRIFSRRSNTELLDGEAFNWVRSTITSNLIKSTVSFWFVEGEKVLMKVFPKEGGPPKLIPLDPAYLYTYPPDAKSREQVQYWIYYEGRQVDYNHPYLEIPAENLLFEATWNPNNPLRGLSLLSSCQLQATANHFINSFNVAYFQNGCHRDLILRVPPGFSEKQVEEYIQRWEYRHGIFEGNAFRISVVRGTDIEVIEPGSTARDGQFMELKDQNTKEINSNLGVPPSIQGDYSNVRYDSIDTEQSIFYEYRFLPLITGWVEWMQSQCIDLHFAGLSANARKAQPKFLSKRMKGIYEKTLDEHPQADIIFLLDSDVLPLAAQLRMKQLENAEKYRKTQAVTFSQAAEWAGIDRPSNEADDLIYIDSSLQRVAAPESNPKEEQQVEELTEQVKSLQAKITDLAEPDAMLPEQKRRLEQIEGFYRAFRGLALESLSQNKCYSLPTAFALAEKHLGEHGLERVIRADYCRIWAISKDQNLSVDQKKEAARGYLRGVQRHANLKRLVMGESINE